LIAIDRLSKECDFLAAFVGKLLHLSDDVRRLPTLLRAAYTGHDAIRAKLVAADHDANKRLEPRRPHGWIAHRVVAFEAVFDLMARSVRAVETKRELRLAGAFHLGDQFR